jgi:predicted enzyme related to lactoylglutathione lyase
MTDPVKVTRLIPTFSVRDMGRAANWYRDVLGWAVQFSDGGYAGVEVDGQILFLAQLEAPGEPGPSQMYVRLAGGVDEYAERVVKRGGAPYNMPKNQPYGMREFNIRDPDGNFLHIGQPTSA